MKLTSALATAAAVLGQSVPAARSQGIADWAFQTGFFQDAHAKSPPVPSVSSASISPFSGGRAQLTLSDQCANETLAIFEPEDDDYDEAEKSTLKILEKLETILPDPVENEDDYKSLWDTIIELHGRETVKFNESQNPVSLDWRIANTVTRVLLHYDFLTLGIINNPP